MVIEEIIPSSEKLILLLQYKYSFAARAKAMQKFV